MIRLPNAPLPPAARNALDAYQRDINAIQDYAERVEAGKHQFALKNKPANRTFKQVRKALAVMCSGPQRCGYCEDSAGTDIEHIQPKDLYPEAVFVWENYLLACSGCNSPKQSRWSVFLHSNGVEKDVTRARNAPVIPPEPGDPLLINPRTENPLDYLMLDLRGTFYFLPRPTLNKRDQRRAEHTIELLRLNSRDFLPEVRRQAYGNYIARIREYAHEKQAEVPLEQRAHLIHALRRLPHPTVWREMKRQHLRLLPLQDLFAAVPEALEW